MMEAAEKRLEESLKLLREDNKTLLELLRTRQQSSFNYPRAFSSASNSATDIRHPQLHYSSEPEDVVIKAVESSQKARSRLTNDLMRFAAG